MNPVEWYYARDDQPLGPVSIDELKAFARTGELREWDLIWREGMVNWVPAGRVQGVFGGGGVEQMAIATPPPAGGEARAPAGIATRDPVASSVFLPIDAPMKADGEESSGGHPLDSLLTAARNAFSPHFVYSAATLFRYAGHFGLFFAMAAMAVLALASGMIGGSLPVATPLATAGILALLMLQHSSSRLLLTLDRLSSAEERVAASSTFFDATSMLASLAGFVALISLTAMALVTQQFWPVSSALTAFILLQFVAVTALHPSSFGVRPTDRPNPVEEGLALLQFLFRLIARIAPVGYGAGSVLGTITVLKALGDLGATEPSGPVLASPETLVGCGLIAVAAAFPLGCYWIFLVGNLICRALDPRRVQQAPLQNELR